MTSPCKPVISGQWQLLFAPSIYGRYVNDHTIVQDHADRWHLFGITSHAESDYSEQERYFVHAVTDDPATPMTELGKVCDNGVRAWAPGVIAHDERYYMYYGPSPTRFATSDELGHWMENEIRFHNTPLDAAHRDHFVFQDQPGHWLMYVTGIHQRCGVISVFESENLVDWTFIRYALTTTGQAPLNPPWGATESPYVVHRDGLYYLFITYTDCALDNYHNTLVFTAGDPTDFGVYDGSDDLILTRLSAHAPEILRSGDRWYITTCGWRGKNTPIEGGVGIAELTWQ